MTRWPAPEHRPPGAGRSADGQQFRYIDARSGPRLVAKSRASRSCSRGDVRCSRPPTRDTRTYTSTGFAIGVTVAKEDASVYTQFWGL